MIVDASALVAIALDELGSERLLEALIDADRVSISAPTMLETVIVLDGRRNPTASRRLDAVIDTVGIDVVPFTAEHARIARDAYRDYGRGSGHAARLNFGDCISYALAAERREPLLYVGDDFAQTDIASAV